MGSYIASDIGGTHIRAACYAEDSLKPISHKRISTQGDDRQEHGAAPLERLVNTIQSIYPAKGEVRAISVAAPGPVTTDDNIVLEAPNIPGWVNLPLRKLLQERFKAPVMVGNDANLAALGEWTFGAGRGHSHMVYITISTGIGSGVIVDGKLMVGAGGLAGELGHLTVLPDGPMCSCGIRGHLEAVAAGPAIADWVYDELTQGIPSLLTPDQPITAEIIANAARQGDPLCIAGLARAGGFIGQALASVLHMFNPTAIIIGGGVAQSGDLIIEPIMEAIRGHVFNSHYLDNLVVARAAFGDDAGMMGALAHARMAYPPS